MIQAIIFDCFGVLTSEGWIPFRQQYFANDAAKLKQANGLMNQLARGQMNDEDFQAAIARLAGVTPQAVRNCMHDNVADQAMFEFVQTLKPHYKIAMLSNVGRNRLSEIFSPGQLSLIDYFGLSSEIGYAKPDAAAYCHVADQLQVPPQECIFVDDQPRYIAGAQATGMQTVQFQTAQQGIADIQALL